MRGRKRRCDGQQYLSLARRKLHDASMRSFLLGNTAARPLIVAGSASLYKGRPVRLAWLAVGDVRNFLTTLVEIPIEHPVEAVLNDASGLVGARNASMLLLAASGYETYAAATWCDALLSDRCYGRLHWALDKISHGSTPPWLVVGRRVQAIAKAWLDLSLDIETALAKRSAAIQISGSGHERFSKKQQSAWRRTGICTIDGLEASDYTVNPTMFDVEAPGIPFIEVTGPAGAFSSFGDLEVGSQEFAAAIDAAWRPLFVALRLRRIHIEIMSRDCVAHCPWKRGSFDAVDTSNAADYAGLWNVLLSAPPLTQDGFLRTEHALTIASSLDAVMSEEFPFDAAGNRAALAAAGWTPTQTVEPRSSTRERVMRIDWRRRSSSEHLMTRREAHILVSQLLERTAPIPMNADMLADHRSPVELSYAWPKTTCATVLEFALKCGRLMKGAVDAVLECPDLAKTPVVRNHVLCLRIEAAARVNRLRSLAPRHILKRALFVDGLEWVSVPLPEMSLFALKAGVFEPALSVALLKDDATLKGLLANQGANLWVRQGPDVFNAAYDWLRNAKLDDVQLIDRLKLGPFREKLSLLLPKPPSAKSLACWPAPAHAYFSAKPITLYFKFLVLLDVQDFAVLGKPIPLDSLIDQKSRGYLRLRGVESSSVETL